MATKIATTVFALIMGFSINSFAGTPESKGEVKPEAKSNTVLKTYHYQSQNPDGTINFAEGPGTNCTSGNKICEWTSSEELESPMLPAQIESNPDVQVTARRN
ncbi:MAG TPA: hypothetical protein DCO90_10500 [Sphingobacterium sp.]|nr:hypothetical protein [Sphingobacterium sp.]